MKTNSRDLRIFGVKFWTHIIIRVTKMTLCNSGWKSKATIMSKYFQIPDANLLTKAMEHYLKVPKIYDFINNNFPMKSISLCQNGKVCYVQDHNPMSVIAKDIAQKYWSPMSRSTTQCQKHRCRSLCFALPLNTPAGPASSSSSWSSSSSLWWHEKN